MSPDQFPAEFAAVRPTLAAITEQTRNLTITAPDQYERAGELLKTVKGALKQIEDQRTSITKPINESLRNANAHAKAAAAPFEDAERRIKSAMIVYSDEQDRIRREAQRRADEEASRERERLAAQAAETARKAREKADQERRAAEAAANEGRIEDAARHAAKADGIEERATEKVGAIEERAAEAVAPVVQLDSGKVAGTSKRELWKFEVTNENAVPREYLMVDEVKIGGVVRALKGGTKIPGVRVYPVTTLASRSA